MLVSVWQTHCPTLRLLKLSLVLIDPPFGWKTAEWDQPDNVWTEKYWTQVLLSVQPHLADKATIAVFGDCFNVLPQLTAGVAAYNAKAESKQLGKLVNPVQLCFNKTNHPHKGVGGYSQSVDNVFLYFYKEAPKIKKLPFEFNGNVFSTSRPSGSRFIPSYSGKTSNPTQKSHLVLKVLLANQIPESGSLVMDLTAGSFSSWLASYLSPKAIHWVGCDSRSDGMADWDYLQSQLPDEMWDGSAWFHKFVAGK